MPLHISFLLLTSSMMERTASWSMRNWRCMGWLAFCCAKVVNLLVSWPSTDGMCSNTTPLEWSRCITAFCKYLQKQTQHLTYVTSNNDVTEKKREWLVRTGTWFRRDVSNLHWAAEWGTRGRVVGEGGATVGRRVSGWLLRTRTTRETSLTQTAPEN